MPEAHTHLRGGHRSTYNVVLTLDSKETWNIQKYVKLPGHVHPQITPEELNEARIVSLCSPLVLPFLRLMKP